MSAASEVPFTAQQRAAIEHVEGALLVSAAAGSGKTAVLAERCAFLVCDAAEPCDVDELLVLTFTRAAAAEMKVRIDAAIRRRASRADADERIHRQLRLIDRASITTIDAFCGTLVREHFHLVGVDPGFSVLAPEDAGLLRADVAADLIDREFDASAPDVFRELLDGYFGSNVETLQKHVLSAHALSQSIVDPTAWMQRALNRLREVATAPQPQLLREFSAIQQRALRSAVLRLDQIAARAIKREGLEKYVAHVTEIRGEFADWLTLAQNADLDALAERASRYEFSQLPRVAKDTPDKELVQAEINAVKGRLKKGDLQKLLRWTAGQLRSDIAKIVPLAEHFFDLVTRFTAAYADAKSAIRSLDFSDIAVLALRILSQSDRNTELIPSPTATAMQRRYRHVLVDEFQDINPLQNALLRLVSRDRASELDATLQSNLFSVGDVKQSIYRFRLAEPQQFVDRRLSLETSGSSLGKVIDLQENFRSRAPLLEAINDVFALLMTSSATGIAYDHTHALRSLRDYAAVEAPFFAGKPIELHLLPRKISVMADADEDCADENAEADSFEREVTFIAERIRTIVEVERPNVTVRVGGATVVRPAKYGDVVVLLRSAKFKSSQVADALRVRNMPVHSDDATGFFTATEVQDVLSVLRLLSNGRQDVPLAALLRSPFFKFAKKDDLLASIRVVYPDGAFHRAAARYAAERTDDISTHLMRVFGQLKLWRQMFRERPVGESLRVLVEHNRFSTFCRALPDGAQRFANLEELLSRGEAFDQFERQGLDRFLAFLDELEAGDELGRPSLGAESDDVIRVMTVHKSKGLEFPIVVIPDLGKGFNTTALNDPILLDRDLGIGMTALDLRRRIRYPSASSTVVRDHARRQAVAEEVRVLYVAITRAREHLVLVGTAKDDAFKRWQEDWSSHDGSLPDDLIHDASTPLDWLGPIAAITSRLGRGTFAVTDHSQDSVPNSGNERAPRATKVELVPPPTGDVAITDPIAREAIARIEYVYPHIDASQQRATMRVTDLVTQTLPGVNRPPSTSPLGWPAAYRPVSRASAADIGLATHRLLQLLDFKDAADGVAVLAQAKRLVERRLMSPRDSAIVDIESVLWFAQSELGREMARPDVRVLREQSLAVAIPPPGVLMEAGDPAERGNRVLIRGRVDALIISPAGLTLIDYKSDRVLPGDIGERTALYAPQLLGYAEALREIAGRAVDRASIVFLTAREIRNVGLGE